MGYKNFTLFRLLFSPPCCTMKRGTIRRMSAFRACLTNWCLGYRLKTASRQIGVWRAVVRTPCPPRLRGVAKPGGVALPFRQRKALANTHFCPQLVRNCVFCTLFHNVLRQTPRGKPSPLKRGGQELRCAAARQTTICRLAV